FGVGGTQQSGIELREASKSGTRRGATWTWRVRRLTQLCIQLGVAGLEDPDEGALRQVLADRLYFRELAAAAEDIEKRRRLPLSAAERPQLVEDDAPGG